MTRWEGGSIDICYSNIYWAFIRISTIIIKQSLGENIYKFDSSFSSFSSNSGSLNNFRIQKNQWTIARTEEIRPILDRLMFMPSNDKLVSYNDLELLTNQEFVLCGFVFYDELSGKLVMLSEVKYALQIKIDVNLFQQPSSSPPMPAIHIIFTMSVKHRNNILLLFLSKSTGRVPAKL